MQIHCTIVKFQGLTKEGARWAQNGSGIDFGVILESFGSLGGHPGRPWGIVSGHLKFDDFLGIPSEATRTPGAEGTHPGEALEPIRGGSNNQPDCSKMRAPR